MTLRKYAIGVGFTYKFLKNDNDRVTAKCAYGEQTGCKWRVHASRQPANDFFYIKTFNSTHTCGNVCRSSKHTQLNSDLVGKLIVEKIRKKPLTSPIDIIDDMKEKYGLDIEYHIAWKGVDNAKHDVFGDSFKSFDNLRWYLDEAKRVNPDNHFQLEVDPLSRRFQRCFIAFGASIRGLKFLRPMIFLDGTFLKGRYKGALLAATCKDGDQGYTPIF